ncbi:tautomerase family protein [Nocardia miyunensis]|uniref:tautomerase family protein n=1 Tax=Nocardia miyunensis TaxID=282684 RepID=UPI000833B3FA|nr:tautomerase family protein [Nocardia miyunensis]
MPLWQIYHPVGVYSDQAKQDFAADITRHYTGVGLPAFYVVVQFQELGESDFLVGGKPSANTVRIVVSHLARHIDEPRRRRRMTEFVNAIIVPYTADRGLHCEFHIEESARDLWMIDGLWPPDAGSEAEKAWAAANSPIPPDA